jgi:hypothetical protein
MPERHFAFAADSAGVQLRKPRIWMQTLQLKEGTISFCAKFCGITASEFSMRSKNGQILRPQ